MQHEKHEQPKKWTSMSEAAYILRTEGINVSVSKLSRLASRGKIETAQDALDERAKLVDLNELRKIFNPANRIIPD